MLLTHRFLKMKFQQKCCKSKTWPLRNHWVIQLKFAINTNCKSSNKKFKSTCWPNPLPITNRSRKSTKKIRSDLHLRTGPWSNWTPNSGTISKRCAVWGLWLWIQPLWINQITLQRREALLFQQCGLQILTTALTSKSRRSESCKREYRRPAFTLVCKTKLTRSNWPNWKTITWRSWTSQLRWS